MNDKKHIVCTGGYGYIGSHTAIALVKAGFEVTLFDNLYNSSEKIIERLEKITGKPFKATIIGDVLNTDDIQKCFDNGPVHGVIHFAGLKAVFESTLKPENYYRTNLQGTINLMEVMRKNNCTNIIFSSSATVYKPSEKIIDEGFPLGCTNPYGWSKLFAEQAITDFVKANKEMNFKGILLRYFNPIGNHTDGTIGESPKGTPNNLLPYIQQVAVGRRPHLNVFGNDYETPDGTGVRDYIDVCDLADGHLKAMEWALKDDAPQGIEIFNLGTGTGLSVMEMLKSFEKACEKTLKYEIAPRRDGDLAKVIADASKAEKMLGFKATTSKEQSMLSAWKWQSSNPNGLWDESGL